MAITFPLATIVGLVLGFLAGLGIGGGSLLMLWLTLIVGMDPARARCINLMFFIPCAICSSLFRLKQGVLPLKKIWLPIVLGCVLAAATSLLRPQLDTTLLKKLFGALLIFTGIKEVLYRPPKR